MRQDPTSQRLPIVIGVTGHRDLRPQDESALAAALEAIFADLKAAYPSTPLLLLTPLAEGADQLAARVARRLAIPYRVPLPMPLENYREDFAGSARLAAFDELLHDADGPPYAMPFFESNDAMTVGERERRAQQYALLAAHLAGASHVLVAFWDGVASETTGGTAQAVRFRALGVPERYLQAKSLLDAPETGSVHHIYTPRSTNAPLPHAAGFRTLRVRGPRTNTQIPLSLGDVFCQIDELASDAPDPSATVYRRIDTFNDDCARVVGSAAQIPGESVTKALMHAAERVATYYQHKFVRALQLLFLSTGLALLTFAIYADLFTHAHPLMLAYLCASGFAVWTYARAQRGRWQDRAQDCRALEIGLNVQQTWDAAGLGRSVADYYIRRQRSELDWIRSAIRTAHTVDRRLAFDEARAIETVRAFVLRQYAYFAGTQDDPRAATYAGILRPGGAKRERAKAALHETLSGSFLRVSFAVSALLVAYGFFAWLAPDVLHGLPNERIWHGDLIFVIATSAVAAALFHDYPARRAHPQHARRYEAMGNLYRRALDALDEAERRTAWRDPADGPLPSRIETARACILELGHEALSENGEWLLMHRELPIELLALG